MNRKLQEQIFASLDGTIGLEDFASMQQSLIQSAEARALYLESVELYESLGETGWPGVGTVTPTVAVQAVSRRQDFPAWFAVAAVLVAVCSLAAFAIGRRSSGESIAQRPVQRPAQQFAGPVSANDVETMVAGHASLRRVLNVRWSDGAASYRSGDLIPAGTFSIDSGVVEMDFFCGASLVVEGPAELNVTSDWELTCVSGRLRASVPPAARGFVVHAADSKIIDLGTEFSLSVTSNNARVRVIDGEVEIHQSAHDPKRLTTGEDQWLDGQKDASEDESSIATSEELRSQQSQLQRQKLSSWQVAFDSLRKDKRLIAYYPFEHDLGDATGSSRLVTNAAVAGSAGDGTLVGPVVASVGRFGEGSTGLEFDRPAARVRTRLDGTFLAFTFAAWVRIDDLSHRYNALFMGDGYENGEPHWQIRNDGKLMLSVMVDDTKEFSHFSEDEQQVVQAAGLHHVYFTEPFWDITKSGQWFHLASVYDPVGRRVDQYVNGVRIGSETIKDEFYTDTLRIGPAEIGNWGQPFRKTPEFAVRNLDGTIDELGIYNAALTESEIKSLYDQGKPLGY
ncbi:LamG-like jellyroll fold domain-containing protein [Rubripirellula reticaptiva]|uniref:FecR protein n=1 Tax=Rubripirellula reticaptiva TaxID=2528013 RepID=A0A5C6F8B6_9BACT|nr:LamG-like jellyroll fold domain-containing protein [Rubripirellula reticaptiva]TWU57638.1 FecR protein [Rubripirellula reticaptiva]